MLHRVLKVLLQAAAVAVAVKLIGRKTLVPVEILKITITIAAILTILEILAPSVYHGAQKGMGLGIGLQTVGFEGFEESKKDALELLSSQKSGAGVEGFDEAARMNRKNNTLYSGDIVKIALASSPSVAGTAPSAAAATAATAGAAAAGVPVDQWLQRNVTSSEVLVQPAVDSLDTNLSKLRFQLVKHDSLANTVIKYGDTVNLMHNANVNNKNTSLFVKISDRLLSHQTGPLFREFQIIDASLPNSLEPVKLDKPFVLKNLKSGGISEGYLVVGDDKKVKNTATSVDGATKFAVILDRVFQVNDAALCVCDGETLFP